MTQISPEIKVTLSILMSMTDARCACTPCTHLCSLCYRAILRPDTHAPLTVYRLRHVRVRAADRHGGSDRSARTQGLLCHR